jgi:hypothetical protein
LAHLRPKIKPYLKFYFKGRPENFWPGWHPVHLLGLTNPGLGCPDLAPFFAELGGLLALSGGIWLGVLLGVEKLQIGNFGQCLARHVYIFAIDVEPDKVADPTLFGGQRGMADAEEGIQHGQVRIAPVDFDAVNR